MTWRLTSSKKVLNCILKNPLCSFFFNSTEAKMDKAEAKIDKTEAKMDKT